MITLNRFVAPVQRLPWPLPAVLAWAAGWTLWWTLRAAGTAPLPAFGAGLLVATLLALGSRGRWRRGIAAVGFPLSALAVGGADGLPPWVWLLLLLPPLAVYPLRAWRDAPLFPTPQDALVGLDAVLGTPRHVLDAGCGLGHGLAALQALWPQAAVEGVEWSPLLAWAARWRCRGASVRRGDMWAGSWAGFDVVYLFQRPESMARAHAKATAEMAAGGWLVSLEFPVPACAATACLQGEGRRPLWVYRVGAAVQHSIGAGGGR